MRLSIAPRVQSRSPSREPGSLAVTPKPKTPRLTAQQAGAKPIRVMGVAGPLRIERLTRNGWTVHTSAITAWSNVTDSIAWRTDGYAARAGLPGLLPLGD
jgi:hypothetical protein